MAIAGPPIVTTGPFVILSAAGAIMSGQMSDGAVPHLSHPHPPVSGDRRGRRVFVAPPAQGQGLYEEKRADRPSGVGSPGPRTKQSHVSQGERTWQPG